MIPSIILVSLLMFLIAKNWPFLLRDVNYAFLQKKREKRQGIIFFFLKALFSLLTYYVIFN